MWSIFKFHVSMIKNLGKMAMKSNFKTKILASLVIGIFFFESATWALSMTYIGDSQSAYPKGLFEHLQPMLLENGEIKSAVAVCGAHIQGFLDKIEDGSRGCDKHLSVQNGQVSFEANAGRTKSIDALAKDSDVVIVQLGDNHLGDVHSAHIQATKMAIHILELGKKCLWIGPASVGKSKRGASCKKNREKKQAVSNAIKSALEQVEVNGLKCEFIDSFSLTKANPPTGDKMCLHYGSNYSVWSDAILDSLRRSLLAFKK